MNIVFPFVLWSLVGYVFVCRFFIRHYIRDDETIDAVIDGRRTTVSLLSVLLLGLLLSPIGILIVLGRWLVVYEPLPDDGMPDTL